MTALQLVQRILASNGLLSSEVGLVSHPAVLNWRQQYSTARNQFDHLQEGIALVKPNVIWVKAREFITHQTLRSYLKDPNHVISIISKVRTPDSREARHLAMMNLHPPPEFTSAELSTAVSALAGDVKPLFVRTDRYYHVYGERLLDNQQWRTWNLRFLMSSFLVSPRYIGHSLFRGYNILRLTRAEHIKTHTPEVIPILSIQK